MTLSLGEKSREDYEAFFNAGADRYLLRHETADEEHYKSYTQPKCLGKPNGVSFRSKRDRLSDRLWNDDRLAVSDGGVSC